MKKFVISVTSLPTHSTTVIIVAREFVRRILFGVLERSAHCKSAVFAKSTRRCKSNKSVRLRRGFAKNIGMAVPFVASRAWYTIAGGVPSWHA